MPIYEYRCKGCGQVFSELRPMREREEPIPCPHCNGVAEWIPSTFATTGGDDASPPCGNDACGSAPT